MAYQEEDRVEVRNRDSAFHGRQGAVIEPVAPGVLAETRYWVLLDGTEPPATRRLLFAARELRPVRAQPIVRSGRPVERS